MNVVNLKPKRYDLEERTLGFFKHVIRLSKKIQKGTVNLDF